MFQYPQDCISSGFASKAIFFWKKYYQTSSEFFTKSFLPSCFPVSGSEWQFPFLDHGYLMSNLSAKQNIPRVSLSIQNWSVKNKLWNAKIMEFFKNAEEGRTFLKHAYNYYFFSTGYFFWKIYKSDMTQSLLQMSFDFYILCHPHQHYHYSL